MNRNQREKEFDKQRTTLRAHQAQLQLQLKELKALQNQLKSKQSELEKISNTKIQQNEVVVGPYHLHFADFLKNWWK